MSLTDKLEYLRRRKNIETLKMNLEESMVCFNDMKSFAEIFYTESVHNKQPTQIIVFLEAIKNNDHLLSELKVACRNALKKHIHDADSAARSLEEDRKRKEEIENKPALEKGKDESPEN